LKSFTLPFISDHGLAICSRKSGKNILGEVTKIHCYVEFSTAVKRVTYLIPHTGNVAVSKTIKYEINPCTVMRKKFQRVE